MQAVEDTIFSIIQAAKQLFDRISSNKEITEQAI